MRRVTLSFVFTFAIAALISDLAFARDSNQEVAENHLSDLLYAEFYLGLYKQLQGTGHHPAEIETTIESIVHKYAVCAISQIVNLQSFEASELIELLARRPSKKQLNHFLSYRDSSEMHAFIVKIENEIKACVATVDQEVGFVRN